MSTNMDAQAVKSGYVKSGKTKVYFDEAGTGEALVLIHAGIADRRMWDSQFAAFSESFRTIRYDLRGFGETLCPDEEYFDHDDLYEILDALKLDKAILVGASNGGRVAIDFALTYPSMTSALVLVSSAVSGYEPPAEIQNAWAAEDAAYEQGGAFPAAEIALRTWIDGPHRTPVDVDIYFRERVREMLLATYKLVDEEQQGEASELDPTALGRLSEIKVPCLALVGDLDFDSQKALSTLISKDVPGGQFNTIEGAAHLPNMEQPEAFNRMVIQFLAARRT